MIKIRFLVNFISIILSRYVLVECLILFKYVLVLLGSDDIWDILVFFVFF